MKKIFGILIMLIIFSANCSAMTFSQPQKIGHAGSYPFIGQSPYYKGGYFFEGTSYNEGSILRIMDDPQTGSEYGAGLARWGEGKNALYCKYDSSLTGDDGLKFGGRNNFLASDRSWRDIFRIDTDKGITLYPLYFRYKQFTELTILGCRQDGTWVKYIDMDAVAEKYFGEKPMDLVYGSEDWGNLSGCVICKGDTIIVPYHIYIYTPYRKIKSGEFRFKWDDAAQWFGVEQVVY